MSRFDRTEKKTKRSRVLRNEMPTAEVMLWSRLKNRQLEGFRFRRQHPVGSYFLDFYCPKIKLCIELDGDQHGQESVLRKDQQRTGFLATKNITVLRFWNDEVYKTLEGVIGAISEQALYLRKEAASQPGGVSSP